MRYSEVTERNTGTTSVLDALNPACNLVSHGMLTIAKDTSNRTYNLKQL